jgi:hypothetical protein
MNDKLQQASMFSLDNITNTMLLLQKTINANQLIHMRRDASHNVILESLVSAKSIPTVLASESSG